MTKAPMYITRDGTPHNDALRWGKELQEISLEDKIIGHDEKGDVRVSTVWIGLDHSFTGEKGLYFETMIFGGEHDGLTERYETEKEALKGHKETVKKYL